MLSIDDDGTTHKRCDFVWSPIRLKRTTEEISTCNRATAEKVRYNFGMLYPEVVGRELKVENLIAKNMQTFLQRVESNVQMAKMTKCKIGMKYNATCPVIVNSFLKCKWSDIDDTGNFCFQCSAIKLLEDLEERCKIIMNDKPARDGKFFIGKRSGHNTHLLDFNNANSMYVNVCEGQKRVESILNFTLEDPNVMHVINWARFCDLTRVVLLANNCLHLSEELFNKLTADGAFNLGPNIYFRPEIMPTNPEVFMRAVENFHEKILSMETKKLHLDMIEGNLTV